MGVGVVLVRQSIGVGHAPLGQVGHGCVRVHILRGWGILDWVDSSPLILDAQSFTLFWKTSLGVECSLTNFFLILISTEHGFSEILLFKLLDFKH